MTTHEVYYATNRGHFGKNRWRPDSYGKKFSNDGMENLRFGRVLVDVDEAKVKRCLQADAGALGVGRGDMLADYLKTRAKGARIEAYREVLRADLADERQVKAKLGSASAFSDLRRAMLESCDVLVYIHGFNVSWDDAVAGALALQIMLNHCEDADPGQRVLVFLFTWPSDGQALPYVSYLSDRSEAAGSGNAFGRGLLKLRDHLAGLREAARGSERLCDQDLHVLCHSMGNFLLQHTLARMDQFTPGNALPRLFEHVFLCAADVDDDALEPGQPLGRVHELARSVSIYHNRGDLALVVSDYTKGNPDRLGSAGAARPRLLHNKVHQIDCTPVVSGLVEHRYYLTGNVNADIRQSIDGIPHQDGRRRRTAAGDTANHWVML